MNKVTGLHIFKLIVMCLYSKSIREYLFSKPLNWTKFWCRAKGHHSGVIWYSNGFKPDMRCKRCNDDLG